MYCFKWRALLFFPRSNTNTCCRLYVAFPDFCTAVADPAALLHLQQQGSILTVTRHSLVETVGAL